MKLIDLVIRPCGGTFRTKSTVKLFAEHIKPKMKILDYGAGSGQISEYLVQKFDTKMALVDVVDYNKTKLKLIKFDGKKLPFKDNSFDLTLIIFVLHHSNYPIEILNEVKRVSEKIIIIEDTPKNGFERTAWHFWDWLLNLGHNVSMTYSAKKENEWIEIFKKLNLKMIKKKNFRPWLPVLGMYQQTIFILENEKQ